MHRRTEDSYANRCYLRCVKFCVLTAWIHHSLDSQTDSTWPGIHRQLNTLGFQEWTRGYPQGHARDPRHDLYGCSLGTSHPNVGSDTDESIGPLPILA